MFFFIRRWRPASTCSFVWFSIILPSNCPETWRTRHTPNRYNTGINDVQEPTLFSRICAVLNYVIWGCLSLYAPTGKAMWERLTAPEDGFSKLQRENIVIIESYGKALMDVVCRDACDGHEISRVRGTQQQEAWITLIINSCVTTLTGFNLVLFFILSLSDVGSGSFGPHSVHRPSESVARLHL